MKPEIIQCGAFRLYRDKKSKYWQVRAEAAPREPLWKSTGEENKTLAMKKAKQLYADWANEKDLKPGEQILFRDLWKEMIEDRATFVKQATLRRHETCGDKYLLPAFGNKFINEVATLWPKLVRTLKKDRPNSTFFNERKSVLAALTYAFEHGLIDRIPPLQTVPGKASRFYVFTDNEISRLIEAAPDEELKLFIMLGINQGMRAGEIAKLELVDVNLENWSLHIKETKTGYDRTIGINQAVRGLLRAQVATSEIRGSKWLFPQVHDNGTHKDQRVFDKSWQKIKKRLGIKGRFHDLRHACATRLAQSTSLSPQQACAFLGMSLRIYDSTYCHLGLEQTRVASTIIRIDAVESTVESAANG